MRTRAQKRQHMPELAQQLQSRLHALEAASSSAPLSPPASKKRKTDDVSASPLLLTPHHPNPRTPTLSILKTPEKPAETKPGVVKRAALCRTLQYTEPVIPVPAENPQAVLQRICSGQMLRNNLPIVGRVEEHQIVRDVLQGHAKQGASLFIIGPPGTGKSSSINELLLEQGFESVETTTMKRKRAVKSNKTAVKLNCSTFTDPAVLYAAVAQLVKKATSWKVPEQLNPFEMDKFITTQRGGSKAKKHSIVVVLDEVDQLLRLPVRMQPTVKEVLHFFVRWAAVAPHSVKFLGIMNGVDMYEQVSRVHVTDENAVNSHVPRVVFGSYTHQNLLLIMQSYVQSALPSGADMTEAHKFIEPRAIELIARKVAARDGDARLAISLLKQSARHALQSFSSLEKNSTTQTQAKVTMRDVLQCVTSMLASPIAQQIKQLPRQAKVLLYVITALSPGSNDNNSVKGSFRQCDMNQVSEELARLRSQPQTAWVPRLSREELQTHLMSLDCYALVKQGGSKSGNKASRPAAAMSVRTFWTTKLSSCVSMSEVSRALQDDTSLSQLLQL
ncbi:hypothetical protein PI124_g11085 [Phytophthora idaei]|nr:hypothetical protein PI125_g10469 [Phytophthora idaei]KAG3153807.1 hypothetical protein PI126_g9907 [Phytophthora idaei]KAG3244124.1 hypothetical protein PI124_g11085 [Phytophthora idaei]